MTEMIGVCTAAACSTMFLSYHMMKQRDKIRELTKKSEEENKNKKNGHGFYSEALRKERQMRKELHDEIDVLRNACLLNPNDIQLLRRCALALIKMTHMYGGVLSYGEVPKMLKEAISKLKKVLEADQDDHEAIFELGVAHFYLTKFDGNLSEEKFIISCKKAVKCFEKVGDKVPETYKGSNMLEQLQNYLRTAPTVESSEMDEMDDEEKPNKYVDIIRRAGIYERDCKAAEIRNAINPNDVHNLRRWGIALTGLTFTNRPDIKRADLLEGAIDKFKKALLLEPDDINTKMELARARLYKCHNPEGKEAKKLFKEYFQLDAELKALNKVVSEENSRRIAQSRTSIDLRSPKEIELHHKNKYNHSVFPVEWPMRRGSSRLGIPAAAMQMRGLRTEGIRSWGSASLILRLLLKQLISRK